MLRKSIIVLGFAVAVWAFCGAIMGIGPQVTSMNVTLTVHAIAGPLGAALAAWVHTRAFGFTTPVQTAAIFVSVALFLDFFLVSMAIMRSFEMFASFVGLWLPMSLIFVASYAAARLAGRESA